MRWRRAHCVECGERCAVCATVSAGAELCSGECRRRRKSRKQRERRRLDEARRRDAVRDMPMLLDDKRVE